MNQILNVTKIIYFDKRQKKAGHICYTTIENNKFDSIKVLEKELERQTALILMT